jgi:hypothetical protein
MLYFIQENGLVKDSLTPEIVQNSLPTIVDGVRYDNALDFMNKTFAAYIKENNIKNGKISVLDPELRLPSNLLDGYSYPKISRSEATPICGVVTPEPDTE